MQEKQTPSKIEQARGGSGLTNRFSYILEAFNDHDLPAHSRRKVFGSLDLVLNELIQALDKTNSSSQGQSLCKSRPQRAEPCSSSDKTYNCCADSQEPSKKRREPQKTSSAAEAANSVQASDKLLKTSKMETADMQKKTKTFDGRICK